LGEVDLESVLNVRRRTLIAIGESSQHRPVHHHHYSADTIYIVREDSNNSIMSINSKVLLFGELQLLCSIFERYTSNILVFEEQPLTKKLSFSATAEENEDDVEGPPIVSTMRQTSISSASSSSPPKSPDLSARTRADSILRTMNRSQSISGTASDYSSRNLEGKRYGNIELPSVSLIEILEILHRNGLELVNVSSDYDKQNVLHQNFIFSKRRQVSQKGGPWFQRTSSFAGT